MIRRYGTWVSRCLGRPMDFLRFGDRGFPVVCFPTSMGSFHQYEDMNTIGYLADKIDAGYIQLFCVDSVDAESWYNDAAPPSFRAARHAQYDAYLRDEFVPFVQSEARRPDMGVFGCSFGAYHAANFGFRHPDKVTGIVTMGGAFDMKDFVDGWYGDDLYFNNPPDYLANCTDPWKYNHIRTVLATGEWDFCWEKNERFAAVLHNKGIRHELYVWGDHSFHDWPFWKPMVRMYLE
jgi:esterase/lipase superfamily enzyme